MASFELIDEQGRMPCRSTTGSVGYDFFVPESVAVPPGQAVTIYTGVRVYLDQDEVLLCTLRSSAFRKWRVFMPHGVGVIDPDYVHATNGGNIGFVVYNLSDEETLIGAGERIGQGVISKICFAENDRCTSAKRSGGFGSTGR